MGGFTTGRIATGGNTGDDIGDDTGAVGTMLRTIWKRALKRLPVSDTVAVTVCVPINMRLHRKNIGPSFPHKAYGALDSTRYCVALFQPNTTDVMGDPTVMALTPKLGVIPVGMVMIAPSTRLATTVLLPPCINSSPITCPFCAEIILGSVTSSDTTISIIRLLSMM